MIALGVTIIASIIIATFLLGFLGKRGMAGG